MTTWRLLPHNPSFPTVIAMWVKGDDFIIHTTWEIRAYWMERIQGGLIAKNQVVTTIEEGKALIDSLSQEQQK